MPKIIKEILNAAAVAGLILAFFYGFFIPWLDRPTVYRSYTSKECVAVVKPESAGDCQDLPESYHLVWIR